MKALEQALRWIAIGGAYLLPFVVFYVASSMFFPFITGKNFYFRIMVEIMGAAWLALALVLPQYRPRKNWILAAFAAFVLIMAIADAQGANPFKSFWSNYERMDGWVTLIHLLVYFAVTVSVLTTENLWRRLFQLSLFVSVSVGFMGVRQLLGWSSVGQGGANGLAGRIDATFGNAIYLAVYMLFNVFISALLWIQEWHERRPGKRTLISVIYGFVIIYDTIILLFTGTRGTTLGLIGGALLAGLIYIFRAENAKRARVFVLGSIAALILGGAGLYAARDTQAVLDVGFLNRLAHLSVNDPTAQTRFMNIGMAWQGVKERPILGWGQENYAIVFDKFYNPGMYNAEPWFDRVHNTPFDWFVTGGILGLLAYLAIFATALWYLWTSRAFRFGESSILIGLVAGYFLHNLFVFDNVTSNILFVTILAYIVWRESEARKTPRVIEKQYVPNPALGFSCLAAVMVVGALGWYANIPSIQQNLTLISALMAASQGKPDVTYSKFLEAANMGALGTQEVREQLAQAAAQVAGANVPADLKQKYLQSSVAEMEKQEKESPLDARFPLFVGLVYEAFGDYQNASKAFEKARELSPTKQSILYEVGQNAMSRNDATGAIKAFKDAYELNTANVTARIYYASLLIRASQDAAADEIIKPIIATGQAADDRISGAYASRKMYGKIAEIWEGKVAAQPGESKNYLTLAAAYYAAGNSAKAIEVIQTAAQKFPEISADAQNYIKQIKDGTAPKP